MMGKQNGKKKKQNGETNKGGGNSPKATDKDSEVFISMAQELKDEGNKMFQKRDYEGAMIKYEKAIKLLPNNHIDVAYLRSNMAACYMQMGHSEYPRAINECNLALEVTQKYGKALLKRARCYEALNRLDLALRDVSMVLKLEPNNAIALEVSERIKTVLEKKGLRVNDMVIELPPEYVEPPSTLCMPKSVKEKTQKKKRSKKIETKAGDEIIDKKVDDSQIEEKRAEDKVVVEEKISLPIEEPKRTVKLVYGEDIRWAQLPLNCSLPQLREVIADRFPSSGAVLMKYRDQEGDLITITCEEELRWAESAVESEASSVRLYLVKVNPQQDPFFEKHIENGDKEEEKEEAHRLVAGQEIPIENGNMVDYRKAENGSCHIDEWIVEFAKLFKDHVGFESNAYLGMHELGIKVYSEAMEEAVTSEEAQDLFDTAAGKFQEMAALALFNWGNVHMSRAKKRVYFKEDSSRELLLEQIKSAYDWAQKEYTESGQKYEAALRIKSDFYEGVLALGQQQFEQAKLYWYFAISNNVDIESWSAEEVVELYNSAEGNMDKGMQMWEESEAQRQMELSNLLKVTSQSEKKGLDGLLKDVLVEENNEQANNMRSQINVLWGTILYERSMMEFKLGVPVWHETLEVAVEKFELAGASPTDVAVMMKNHVSNYNAVEGIGFKIDEIVQAWNEMYEAKKWQSGVPSFRLEPLLRRKVSKLYHALELT
ncbi:protein PHOX1-like [Mercurialis annua]|uniref:protein PHOX1-like n=1 Tax=Mercurialis annua TaxID=3986 RepID=UPI00215F828C|nr:protein PHOX1-like [Mercurialis annua]